MAIVVGSRIRVKQDYNWIEYRGIEYTVLSDNGFSINVRDGERYGNRLLTFNKSSVEEIPFNKPDHCSICDAITPGRTICCDCNKGK